MLNLFLGRDLPPPPPQFDDPPPATGLEQFGRGRKCFDNIVFSFTFSSRRIFGRRVHNPDNAGHSELPGQLSPSQLSTSLPGRTTILSLLSLLLLQPYCHTGCNLSSLPFKHLLISRQRLGRDRIQILSCSRATTTFHGFTTIPLPSPRYLILILIDFVSLPFFPAFTTPHSLHGINRGVLLQIVDGFPRNPGRLQPLCAISSCQPRILSPPR